MNLVKQFMSLPANSSGIRLKKKALNKLTKDVHVYKLVELLYKARSSG